MKTASSPGGSLRAELLETTSEVAQERMLTFGQWSMRSLLLFTGIVGLALGIWRSDGTLGALFGMIAFPAMVMSWAERFFRLDPSDLLGKSLDVFMAGGAVLGLGYCSLLIAATLAGGYVGSALFQLISSAAIGAAFGVTYCLLVIAFYGVAKCLIRW